MHVSQKPIVLLSLQRSGTNFLRRILGSHPAIDPLFGEIFDPNFIGHELNFFHFYLRLVAEDPSYCLPDRRLAAFEMYIEHLDAQVTSDRYILDIKYNSLRHLESYWPEKKDVLTQHIINKQWPTIHLIRRDLLAAAYSQIRAYETGMWLTEQRDYSDSVCMTVDPARIVQDVIGRTRSIQRQRGEFIGARLIELVYEDLTDGPDGLNATVMESIGEFLGVTNDFTRRPETRKLTTQSISKAIRNYDEVLAVAAARKVALAISLG